MAIHFIPGCRTKIQNKTKPQPARNTHREVSGELPSPERATARASRIQAATSLTAAADKAIFPMSVVRSLISARIRAKTGKAVMERATPMKTRKGALLAPSAMELRSANEVPMPKINGRVIPASAMERAFFPVRLRDLGSSSRPTRKRKKMSPKLASVSRTVRLFAGKTVLRNFELFPRADGPSNIPP